MSELTLAVDIGGTKIAVGLVDGQGRLVHHTRQPTPKGDAEQIWAVVDELMKDARAAAGGTVCGVGIGSGGPIDLYAGTVNPINIPSWHGFPLRQRIAAAVPGVPVRLAGDGLCMTLGEHWRGAGRGANFLLGMVVSTGIGGGLVLDGAPYDGRTGNAGHVGHVVVEVDGPPCACGGRGCAEAIAAGPRMARWARENGWQAGPQAGAKELADAAAAGDPVAMAAFHRGATAVAAMIASVAAVCDLDLVVIGGGVARSGPLLFDPLREALGRHARLDYLRRLRVVPAELGGAAGLVGAAALIAGPAAAIVTGMGTESVYGPVGGTDPGSTSADGDGGFGHRLDP
jgi:glucokinase